MVLTDALEARVRPGDVDYAPGYARDAVDVAHGVGAPGLEAAAGRGGVHLAPS